MQKSTKYSPREKKKFDYYFSFSFRMLISTHPQHKKKKSILKYNVLQDFSIISEIQ